MALSSGFFWSVIKDMAQMCSTTCTTCFSSRNTYVVIYWKSNIAFNFTIKARPTRSRVKFMTAKKKRALYCKSVICYFHSASVFWILKVDFFWASDLQAIKKKREQNNSNVLQGMDLIYLIKLGIFSMGIIFFTKLCDLFNLYVS